MDQSAKLGGQAQVSGAAPDSNFAPVSSLSVGPWDVADLRPSSLGLPAHGSDPGTTDRFRETYCVTIASA